MVKPVAGERAGRNKKVKRLSPEEIEEKMKNLARQGQGKSAYYGHLAAAYEKKTGSEPPDFVRMFAPPPSSPPPSSSPRGYTLRPGRGGWLDD